MFYDENSFPPHLALHFATLFNCFVELSRGWKTKPMVPVDILASRDQVMDGIREEDLEYGVA